MGRSDIRGDVHIRKRAGRHIIDATLQSRGFDIDDLSDAHGRAIAAAKRQRFGARLLPDTAIDLDNIARTDGIVRLKVDRLLWPEPIPFRSLSATLTVDHSLMKIRDLKLGLSRGTITGQLSVDQREGEPILSTDLKLDGGRLIDFVPDAQIDAPMLGRWRTTGSGKTIRSAIGHSSGMIAVVASEGMLPDRTATLLGQDLGGIFKGKNKTTELRCMIVRLKLEKGLAIAQPVIIDTSRAVTRAAGTIDLTTEQLALTVKGLPKRDVVLRVPGAVSVTGTIKDPDIELPAGKGVAGTVLSALGNAFDGKADPVASDTDCSAMALQALARR